MLTDRSHEQYARLFIYQRIKDVYNTLNKTGDGEVDCEELQEYLTYLNFKATKKQVHDMVWEVDDSSEGVIRLDTIRALLTRMQKAKNRGVGTGSNLLRTLIEYMMFDTDGSGGIEIEEVQQMFFIYYGYKGQQLDLKIKASKHKCHVAHTSSLEPPSSCVSVRCSQCCPPATMQGLQCIHLGVSLGWLSCKPCLRVLQLRRTFRGCGGMPRSKSNSGSFWSSWISLTLRQGGAHTGQMSWQGVQAFTDP